METLFRLINGVWEACILIDLEIGDIFITTKNTYIELPITEDTPAWKTTSKAFETDDVNEDGVVWGIDVETAVIAPTMEI